MLRIQHPDLIDGGAAFAVRFTGPRVAFQMFVDDLKMEGYKNAHWDLGLFNGRGGWMVDYDLFLFYKDRFVNGTPWLHRVQGTPLPDTHDINYVPF